MKKGKTKGKTIGKIIGFLILLFIVLIIVIPDDDTGNDVSDVTDEPDVYSTEQKLFDADNLKVTFLKAFEEDSIDGMLYFQLLVENDSDSKVWIALEDASVNGYDTLALSGVPMEINAGNKNKNPFFFNEENVGIESLEDLENVKFKVSVYEGDSTDLLFQTEELCVNFK